MILSGARAGLVLVGWRGWFVCDEREKGSEEFGSKCFVRHHAQVLEGRRRRLLVQKVTL
jgi:hypothetical protein